MKTSLSRPMAALFLALSIGLGSASAPAAEAIPFAGNGGLKMLYDNRMYPQALEHQGNLYLVWRGKQGLPYIIAYDLETRTLSAPVMMLQGRDANIDREKYRNDHHYAPVVWVDGAGHLHTLFACHVRTGGIHLVSKRPGDITQWDAGAEIAPSISYPKVHKIYGGKTLIYFRHEGHLGHWTYRISSDNGKTWQGPEHPPIDMDREPQDGYLAAHAGSYHTTQLGKDLKTLHLSFIWKIEEPVYNTRYKAQLHDHTQRYNLYYMKLDLSTGKAYNYHGAQLETPVRKLNADRACLIWDTDERVASVGTSIYLDENDEPYFVLPVSDETPYRCTFYFVCHEEGEWRKYPMARTGHPFNACHLERDDDGTFRAYLVVGDGETPTGEDMDQYGWGDRIEEWVSKDGGKHWKRAQNLTPETGYKYNNLKFVSKDLESTRTDMFLYYRWQDTYGMGTAYLWDNRE